MSTKMENVWDYPRPPALQKSPRTLQVVWIHPQGEEVEIAKTNEAYRVLETSHPPTYYLPPSSLSSKVTLELESKSSFCEWKGRASYHTLRVPSSSSSSPPIFIKSRIWSYASPTASFAPIASYLSFYASDGGDGRNGKWVCRVDGEDVIPQEGDFYGGWKTSDISGGKKGMKGGPGTWGW
ncbi:hypothetical protein BDY24DRAFT_373124 [Mrakia frigida]|uniref:DUF427 domain-containing protein n=1 Tax=Mrakia frigida TaxID=29902 RepID=UPI003FCC0B28